MKLPDGFTVMPDGWEGPGPWAGSTLGEARLSFFKAMWTLQKNHLTLQLVEEQDPVRRAALEKELLELCMNPWYPPELTVAAAPGQ